MRATGPADRRGQANIGKAGDASGSGSMHERVYQTLRQRILVGGILPGRPVTVRGMAKQLGVGVMPVREAVRRLIAERALELRDNRRVCVPAMTPGKFDEIIFARCQLEPELAQRALPNIDAAAMAGIEAIDEAMNRSIAAGDAGTYMRDNFEFHFAIYRRAGAETLLHLVESVWLQFGPFMRVAYGRSGTAELAGGHSGVRRAIRSGNAKALAAAITADIMHGMRMTGELALAGEREAPPPNVLGKPRGARSP